MMRVVDDQAWAVLTIWQEARGEGQDGRIAVAEVIRNRMQRKYSSDGTVVGTVLKPLQFSGWNTYDPNRIASARLEWDDLRVQACADAWQVATVQHSNLACGAVLYCNLGSLTNPPKWLPHVQMVAKIGNHTFYVPKTW